MKKFVIEMLSRGSAISSKRVVAVLAFVAVIISGVCEQFFGLKPGEQYLGILELIILGTFGLNSAIDILKKDEQQKE